MRGHDHEVGGAEELRPKSARLDPPEVSHLLRAGAAGRTDVVGAAGMLGLQRLVGNAGVGAMLDDQQTGAEPVSPVHEVVGSGGGQPLDTDTRADMEARLGHDFGDVRVHNDTRAHDSAVAVNAHAYTVGSNVVFQRDQYDPTSSAGRVTLAHELTHVVQQRSGPVDGTPAEGGIRLSDPGDRYEREAAATAERAMVGPAPVPAASVQTASASVQRDAAPEEEAEEPAVQGTFVQRQEDEAAEEEA